MKMNRRTLTLIVASLCGVGHSAVGQEEASQALRSTAGRIADGEVAKEAQSGASQSISDVGAATSPSDKSIAKGSVAAPKTWASATPAAATTRPVLGTGASSISDCTSPGCTTDGCSGVDCTSMGGGNGLGRLGSRAGLGGGARSSHSVFGGLASGLAAGCDSDGCGNLGWSEFDTLLWWGRGLNGSPVIVGGNSPSVLPTNPLLGGTDNPLGTDMLVGLRGNVGFWLDDCQQYGIGGRAWGIVSNDSEQVITNGGNSTGISFFNTSLNQPDTYLVNLDRGPFGKNVGEIGVTNELDVFSGDIYGRALLLGDRYNRTDLIGGYTFLRLDSGYGLRSKVTDGWTDAPPPVTTVTTIRDQFSTKNEFHGGHVGLQSNITRGRLGFGLMGKVAMGNMTSTSVISGSYNQVPPPPSAPDIQSRGLFAQSSNIGTVTRDVFTFIPEMNGKMRYQIGRFQVGVGYTLVVLPEVAIAASQVDTNVDALGIINPPTTSPVNRFNTESYFLHGIDLGVTYNF